MELPKEIIDAFVAVQKAKSERGDRRATVAAAQAASMLADTAFKEAVDAFHLIVAKHFETA